MVANLFKLNYVKKKMKLFLRVQHTHTHDAPPVFVWTDTFEMRLSKKIEPLLMREKS